MAVKVEIFARNLQVTDHIKDYVTKKAGKLGRYLPELNDVRVDLAYIKSARNVNDRMVAQITTYARRAILRTEERDDDLLPHDDVPTDAV